MATIGDNIKRLREEAELSQEALAHKIGKTRAAISQYESGLTVPRMGVIEDLAEVFGVRKSEIVDEVPIKHPRTFSPVPLLGRIAAGEPIPMEEDGAEMREAPTRYVLDDPDVYLLEVKGDSINRRIANGQFALVSPKYQDALSERDLFAVAVNGYDATIKHIRKLSNGIALVPDSYDPTYREQVFDFAENDCETVTILGKIVWSCAAF